MRLNGRVISGAAVEYIVIPRNDGDIVLKATAILDYDEFEKLCPEPKAPGVMKPGGQMSYDYNDRGYKHELEQRSEKRFGYLILKSLSATEGLEFETVSLTDPGTWHLWKDEFKNAGLTQGEISIITQGVLNANGVNEQRLKEARDRFLLTLSQQAG